MYISLCFFFSDCISSVSIPQFKSTFCALHSWVFMANKNQAVTPVIIFLPRRSINWPFHHFSLNLDLFQTTLKMNAMAWSCDKRSPYSQVQTPVLAPEWKRSVHGTVYSESSFLTFFYVICLQLTIWCQSPNVKLKEVLVPQTHKQSLYRWWWHLYPSLQFWARRLTYIEHYCRLLYQCRHHTHSMDVVLNFWCLGVQFVNMFDLSIAKLQCHAE